MPLKFNALTGNLDLIGEKKLVDGDTNIPSGQSDGYASVVKVGSDGRLYFFVEGERYYISGVAEAPAIHILQGQPIGLMGVTYAGDVS